MMRSQELEDRLRQSCRTLRAWTWMSTVSTDRDEIVHILLAEARDLVELGRQHPGQAKRIGSIIVYYQRLIEQLKDEKADAA